MVRARKKTMKYNILKTVFVSFIEAFVKYWDQLLVSSRAYGDRVLIYSTIYRVYGSKGLHRRKAHFSALLRKSGISFKLIQVPDVSEFGIVLGLVNPLLLAFGLVGRYSSQIELTRYRNRRFNKYLVYMFTKLVEHLAAGRTSRFWTLALILVKRSTVYMMACSWKIDKNLYRNLGLREVTKVFREVNSLRRTFSNEMKFHRTYIPKGVNEHRPLGVPTLPWRIYLNMLLHPLVLAHPLPANQHGFKPGFGTLTAWSSMFKDVLPSANIFEGDLRQCFPSVNLLRLAVTIYKQGMPANVLGLYHTLNMVSPEFKGAILLNENQFLLRDQYKELLRKDPTRTPLNFDRPIWDVTEEWVREQILLNSEAALGIHGEVLLNFLDSSKDQLQHEVIMEGLTHIFVEFRDGTPISEFVHYADWLKWIGTAQGSPLSPYLAALALSAINDKLPAGVKALFYADDFILFGDGLNDDSLVECKKAFAEAGFTIHSGKSQWVKKNGRSLIESVKFLGLTFNFRDLSFASDTRKGNKLIFTKQDLLDFEFDKRMALSETSVSLMDKAMSAFKRAIGNNNPFWRKVNWGLARYYYALSNFRKWFVTEFQWDLLALLRTLLLGSPWIIRRFLTLGLYELRDLNAARAFAQITYPEDKSISRIIDKSDTGEVIASTAVEPGIIHALNYVNPYLKSYRSKYTFVNFCASKFRGTILSRMYAGSWLQKMPLQCFRFKYAKFSLAQMMYIFSSPNIFNGSSIAANILIKSLSQSNRTKRFSQVFPKAVRKHCRRLGLDDLLTTRD